MVRVSCCSWREDKVALVLLLLTLQLIPPSWFLLWQDADGVMAALVLTLYSYI